MKLEGATPMLRTWDLPGTIAFYTELLGFRRVGTAEDEGDDNGYLPQFGQEIDDEV